MRAYNYVTIVCVLIIIAASMGTAYSLYNSTLTDDETVSVEDRYGIAELTESAGVYTLRYTDTTADSVYLTMRVSGLSGKYAPGTIVDVWIGKQDVTAAFGGTYDTTVVNGELTYLARPLASSESTYTDGDASYVVTCYDDTITVTKGGANLSVLAGTFHDGSAIYTVDASGYTVSGVSRLIPINGDTGTYYFDDEGYRYAIGCSGSSVTSASRCKVVSSQVDSLGNATFKTWTFGLTQKSWQDTVALYCGGTADDLGIYYVEARFYSAEVAA